VHPQKLGVPSNENVLIIANYAIKGNLFSKERERLVAMLLLDC